MHVTNRLGLTHAFLSFTAEIPCTKAAARRHRHRGRFQHGPRGVAEAPLLHDGGGRGNVPRRPQPHLGGIAMERPKGNSDQRGDKPRPRRRRTPAPSMPRSP